jgi:heptosyltransferase-2
MEKDYKNILVRLPNWIGDLVMALPILDDLKNKYPSSKITVMLKDHLKDLVINNKNIDEIYPFRKPKNKIYPKKIIKDLKEKNFDLAILLTNSLSSSLWLYFSKIKEIIGFRNFRSIFLTKKIKFPKDKKNIHQINLYKNLLIPLNIKISKTLPILKPDEESIEKMKKLLIKNGYNKNRRLIAINAFAAYGSAKCYPLEKYISLTEKLIEDKNNIVIFIGDKKNQIKNLEIFENKNVVNLIGKTTLKELVSLISFIDIFISNDSGPMHIASALNKNLIALFGSTSDIMTSPCSKNQTIINKKVICSPCFKRKCPIDLKCMNEIKVDEILNEIKKFYV